MYSFPSEAWIAAYRDALNASADYREAASSWHHGPIALVIRPNADAGLPEGFATWLDVDGGVCHAARGVTLAEAEQAPFCLLASYAEWQQILRRRLDPIVGILTRRIELRGDLLTLLRYVRSSRAMVHCATTVPSSFSGRLRLPSPAASPEARAARS